MSEDTDSLLKLMPLAILLQTYSSFKIYRLKISFFLSKENLIFFFSHCWRRSEQGNHHLVINTMYIFPKINFATACLLLHNKLPHMKSLGNLYPKTHLIQILTKSIYVLKQKENSIKNSHNESSVQEPCSFSWN